MYLCLLSIQCHFDQKKTFNILNENELCIITDVNAHIVGCESKLKMCYSKTALSIVVCKQKLKFSEFLLIDVIKQKFYIQIFKVFPLFYDKYPFSLSLQYFLSVAVLILLKSKRCQFTFFLSAPRMHYGPMNNFYQIKLNMHLWRNIIFRSLYQ